MHKSPLKLLFLALALAAILVPGAQASESTDFQPDPDDPLRDLRETNL